MALLTSNTASDLITRINRLHRDSKGQWGKMTVEQMMVHCAAGIRLGLGELPSKIRISPIRGAIARWLYVDLFPFPKSAPSPAELNINKKLTLRLEFDEAKKQLVSEIKKMAEIPDNFQFPPHPIFHKLSARQWRKLGYKHLDHHLKQFGV